MFKQLIAPLTLLVATSVNAQSFEIDTEAFAGTEFIRDQDNVLVEYDPAIHTFVTEDTPVAYAGREQIPHLDSNPSRSSFIIVTNTTSSIVSFFFNPVFRLQSGGTRADNLNQTYTGVFSSSNDPLDGAGSDMPPDTVGGITYPRVSAGYLGHAEILWDSSTCFDTPPLITSVRLDWYRPNRSVSTDYYYVNNGNNW